MTTALLIALGLVLVICATLAIFAFGFRRGKDAGWCAYHYAAIEKERARRDKRGRFVEKGGAK